MGIKLQRLSGARLAKIVFFRIKYLVQKLVTIIYALGGIPIFFICLGHIGETLSKTFRFLYWRIFCSMCSNRKKVQTAAK